MAMWQHVGLVDGAWLAMLACNFCLQLHDVAACYLKSGSSLSVILVKAPWQPVMECSDSPHYADCLWYVDISTYWSMMHLGSDMEEVFSMAEGLPLVARYRIAFVVLLCQGWLPK
ncbi:hypothetical protein GOP47_0020854 [Adiantum capillus-veneris]|uniref:Uncharacterized protein n=1 Tax=Adiantum capillus-veneris TaxID=13818 RepID=A0A9D4UBJ4_ADICA|nr:hypothetical protein GOP47_0020854 [Adiantum capillus-veneris]